MWLLLLNMTIGGRCNGWCLCNSFLSQSLAVNDPGRRWVCFPKVDDPDHMGAAVRPDHSVTVVNHPADQSAGQAGGVGRRSDCNHAVMGRYTTEILSRSKTTNEISLELPFPLAIVILKGVLADWYPIQCQSLYTDVTNVKYCLFKSTYRDASGWTSSNYYQTINDLW